MAIRLKPTAQIAAKFAARASAAGPDYVAGVQNPKRDQAETAIAAAPAYAAGVQAAIADNRFVKGVQAAGSAKWKRKAETTGAQRFPTGASAAKDDFQKGVDPYLQTIASLDLDATAPRYPKGDPRNYARVQAVGTALRAQRLGSG